MTKAFISYHHGNDQWAKEHLSDMARLYGCFDDVSVDTGSIQDDDRTSEAIRVEIRDKYLVDSQVTILLCGTDTKGRKHVDWELMSSMFDGPINKRSGILAINLPQVNRDNFYCSTPYEKSTIYPDRPDTTANWIALTSRADHEAFYPMMPARIIDNLVATNVNVSVVPWDRVANNPAALKWLVDQAAFLGKNNPYDMSRKMRRQNNPLARPSLADLLYPR